MRAGRTISKPEGRSLRLSHLRNRKKGNERKGTDPRDLRDSTNHVHAVGVSKGKERKKGAKEYLKEY